MAFMDTNGEYTILNYNVKIFLTLFSFFSNPTNCPRVTGDCHSRQIDADHLDVGHLLHRIAEPFTPEAALLIPAVRHMVDTEGRDVVDDDPPHVEPPDGPERLAYVPGVNPRLEAVH